ncbi:hypothetical protein PUNSTDRAFT_42717 [Punctularia strigosozonata HHB-11173 SS5]|uniref:uncharacterized protein n=1 Tax=Punctularia strigosozonata (strain HHB-11173) TaxID=741275 RepID=UPI0004416882|nr:uncharacterized protein PUNSTDRAFT_42717 [Punctularia strigosozonata HHB-11173 SS5]EIN11462.1 hypothetical protein PUNSTDRAFT_42717 [Punctularia strigosozonata HHB-11173 SS5]
MSSASAPRLVQCEAFGRIDVVYNNAGAWMRPEVEGTTESEGRRDSISFGRHCRFFAESSTLYGTSRRHRELQPVHLAYSTSTSTAKALREMRDLVAANSPPLGTPQNVARRKAAREIYRLVELVNRAKESLPVPLSKAPVIFL